MEIQKQIDSASSIFDKNPLLALDLVESAVEKAVAYGYQLELADGYLTLGQFNMELNENKRAIPQLNRALTVFKQLENWARVYESNMLLGDCYAKIENLDNAFKHYKNAHFLAEKGIELKASLKAKLMMAQIELLRENYNACENLLLEIRQKANENNLNDLMGEAEYKLGELYEIQGDFSQANGYYIDAQTNAYETRDNQLLNQTNWRMSQSYSNNPDELKDQKENVFNSLNNAEDYFQQERDTIALIETTIQKADYLTAEGEMEQAIQELNRSIELSKKLGDIENELQSQKKLYNVYATSDNLDEAKKAYTHYESLLDSANKLRANRQNELIQKQIALKTVEKELDVMERERMLDHETILLLEKEQEVNNAALDQQRVLLYVMGFILIVFVFISILVYRNTKAKKRAHQLLYLKNLRAQMNPHFIFNSLNSVNNYIAKSNERAANKYLAKFSKLMRMVLDYSQVEFISLASEIELLRLYVELEHERFKDKFDFEFEVDSSINAEQHQIPPMLVQPFIENAVWHGLRYKKEKGLLRIHFKDRGDHVEILVEDNGIGRTKSQAIKTVNQKKHQSSGMRNVENRTEMIRTLFRKKIDYEIADLETGTGTKVTLKLFDHESR
jgi:tetratricopeptide (TPR) repeat protein